ncbi:hypothetical protein B0H17DRAFT_1150956 [Mycena rosella]|uniref:Uncharacterized protein n=1 Tax=Mycena rosella TaxID=1033263 RepID=A0AAD7FLB8_MYCRO|nr:hypothetical protein B0H17DRAFT_1150956 [Mycena rosella]
MSGPFSCVAGAASLRLNHSEVWGVLGYVRGWDARVGKVQKQHGLRPSPPMAGIADKALGRQGAIVEFKGESAGHSCSAEGKKKNGCLSKGGAPEIAQKSGCRVVNQERVGCVLNSPQKEQREKHNFDSIIMGPARVQQAVSTVGLHELYMERRHGVWGKGYERGDRESERLEDFLKAHTAPLAYSPYGPNRPPKNQYDPVPLSARPTRARKSPTRYPVEVAPPKSFSNPTTASSDPNTAPHDMFPSNLSISAYCSSGRAVRSRDGSGSDISVPAALHRLPLTPSTSVRCSSGRAVWGGDGPGDDAPVAQGPLVGSFSGPEGAEESHGLTDVFPGLEAVLQDFKRPISRKEYIRKFPDTDMVYSDFSTRDLLSSYFHEHDPKTDNNPVAEFISMHPFFSLRRSPRLAVITKAVMEEAVPPAACLLTKRKAAVPGINVSAKRRATPGPAYVSERGNLLVPDAQWRFLLEVDSKTRLKITVVAENRQ